MFVQCALQTDRIIAKYLAHSITQLHKQCSLTSHWPRCRQARMRASSCGTIAARLQVTWNWADCYKHRTAWRDNTPADNVTAVSRVFIFYCPDYLSGLHHHRLMLVTSQKLPRLQLSQSISDTRTSSSSRMVTIQTMLRTVMHRARTLLTLRAACTVVLDKKSKCKIITH